MPSIILRGENGGAKDLTRLRGKGWCQRPYPGGRGGAKDRTLGEGVVPKTLPWGAKDLVPKTLPWTLC